MRGRGFYVVSVFGKFRWQRGIPWLASCVLIDGCHALEGDPLDVSALTTPRAAVCHWQDD